jgi:hypothetical protein
VVIDEVHRITGRVDGQHPGGERPLQFERVGAISQCGEPGPQRLQLRDRRQPEGGAGVGPAQVLDAFDGVDSPREPECCGAQDGQVVIPAGGATGHRGEDRLRPDPVQVGVQQHRPRIPTPQGAGIDP